MQVKIDLKVFIIALVFLITRQLELYLVFMLFAIIHEAGHLFIGMLLGFKPKKVEIIPLGVSANFYVNINDYNRKVKKANILVVKKILITLAGPITNFIIAIIFYALKISFGGISNETLVYTNIIIGLYNLIPIYPLDGGRIFKYIVHIVKGSKYSYEYTNFISNTCVIILTMISSLVILWSKNIAVLFILIYLWGLVMIQNKRYKAKMQIYKLMNNINVNDNEITK